MNNPFRNESIYHAGFDFWQKKEVVTRNELADAIEATGMTKHANPDNKHRAAVLSATILLSPRLTSDRGDCRGNVCTYGHLYYAEQLPKNKGEEKRFKLCWRETPMTRIDYRRPSQTPKKQIDQVKIEVNPTLVKTSVLEVEKI